MTNTIPGKFIKNPNFKYKNNFLADKECKQVDIFCDRIRDGILNLIANVVKENRPNVSNQELPELQKCNTNKTFSL